MIGLEKYELGLKKKSFSLYYHGGEIWCEHLDSFYEEKELLIHKFKEDLVAIKRPSTSSLIIVNLDESQVDIEILDFIISNLHTMNKSLQKVVFVGLNLKLRRYIKKSNRETSFVMTCINDYEKAKEWLFL